MNTKFRPPRAVLHAAGFCAIAAAAILQAGCDNRHLLGAYDAGDDGPTLPQADGATDWAQPQPGTDGSIPDAGQIIQSWTGYIENYMFPSGSDAIKILFSADAAGNLTGTVRLGSGTPPPPATDPTVGYPADLLGSFLVDIHSAGSYIAEAFAYSMRAGTLTGGRLRFGVATRELWTDWCALQTPAPPQGVCDEPVCKTMCLPNRGFMAGPNGCAFWNPATQLYDERVDCGKLALCNGSMVCLCEPSGCAVQDFGTAMAFDIAITNDVASGSVAGQLGDHNVHFTKDP